MGDLQPLLVAENASTLGDGYSATLSRIGGCYKVVFQWREVKRGNLKELTEEHGE